MSNYKRAMLLGEAVRLALGLSLNRTRKHTQVLRISVAEQQRLTVLYSLHVKGA